MDASSFQRNAVVLDIFSEDFLMTPGPTKLSLRVMRAMMMPGITPGDPKFVNFMDETEHLLKKLMQTKNEVVFFPGSGRVAIESAILSVINRNAKVLTVNNGIFGKWLRLIVERVGGRPIELVCDWRRAIDPDKVRAKLERERDIKMVAVVHNETSTGVVNPVEEIGNIVKDHGALYLVDSVSSLGGDVVLTDEWCIDLNCSGSYKCIGSSPGLAIVSISDEAWKAMKKRNKPAGSFAFDLYRWLEMWIPKERGGKLIWEHRRQPIEPAPHITYALNEALKIIFEEGLSKRFEKNRKAGKALRAAIRKIGLELYPLQEKDASNTVTGIIVPLGINSDDIIGSLRKEFGVIAAGNLEELHGKVFRIAHMGITSDKMYMLYAISALEQTLNKLGFNLEIGSGVEVATKVFT